MLATLQALGVMPSFSRPSVSNDNPYSEAQFRTFKYRPDYPVKAFENVNGARYWVEGFVSCYNHEHLHSSIKFFTPDQRHRRLDDAVLAKRVEVYRRAKEQNPSRWSGATRDWAPVTHVYLNSEKEKSLAA